MLSAAGMSEAEVCSFINLRETEQLHLTLSTQNLSDQHLDAVLLHFEPKDVAGQVVAQVSLEPPQKPHYAAPPARLLERLFDDPRVDGVQIQGVPGGHLLAPKLAEVIGMLASPDPLGTLSDGDHIGLSIGARESDEPYAALYHAQRARTQEANTDDYFFTMLDAQITLNLYEPVNEALAWYEERGDNLELGLYQARCMTLSGHPEDGAEVAQALCDIDHLRQRAFEELGWALIALEKPEEAFDAFAECMIEDERALRAVLGQGVALLDHAIPRRDEAAMNQALNLLQEVIDHGGYHRAEAWHHVGTIYLGAAMHEDAVRALRRSLEFRNNTFTRRNLAVALRLSGQLEEAGAQCEMLDSFDPNVAVEARTQLA